MAELTVHLKENATAQVFPYRLLKPVLKQGLGCENLHIFAGQWIYCFRDFFHDGNHAGSVPAIDLSDDFEIIEWP